MAKGYTHTLLEKYELKAKKKWGQNFLVAEGVLTQIIAAAALTDTDEVVEVGPGLGILTARLCQMCARVTALELDPQLFTVLRTELTAYPNLELVHTDALLWPPPDRPYKVVANIPYYITSPLINHFVKNAFLQGATPPSNLILLVQKEVARKICAGPGDLSVLALNVQTFAQVRLLKTVRAGSFHPAPKVDSALLQITPHRQSDLSPSLLRHYFHLISTAFQQKRKLLSGSLRNCLPLSATELAALLEKIGIPPQSRPQDLSIPAWQNLARATAALADSAKPKTN